MISWKLGSTAGSFNDSTFTTTASGAATVVCGGNGEAEGFIGARPRVEPFRGSGVAFTAPAGQEHTMGDSRTAAAEAEPGATGGDSSIVAATSKY
jgi:hypothetical protein